MRVKRILLTGDDGYLGIGTRVLIALLKDSYELKIVATLTQQSGVGGGVDLQSVKKWGRAMVDGIPAVWLDGSPSDTMEFAASYFKKPFDLIISGINWGANIGFALNSSGTFAAALRGVGAGLSSRALIMSWHTPQDEFFKEHRKDDNLEPFLEFPGRMAKRIFDICLENDLWGKTFVNINFPREPTEIYKITKVATDITKFYKYPLDIDYEDQTVKYPDEAFADEENLEKNDSLDTGALNQGFISVSPVEFLG